MLPQLSMHRFRPRRAPASDILLRRFGHLSLQILCGVLSRINKSMLAEEVPLAREQRKLAAILAADVVGYPRLMGRDESGILAVMKVRRSSRPLARIQ